LIEIKLSVCDEMCKRMAKGMNMGGRLKRPHKGGIRGMYTYRTTKT
jgi:hypothetical protein